MADYPTTRPDASSPDSTHPDPVATQQLLATLAAIPRDELPDGDDRNALAMLIRYGLVDNLYRPMGCDYHNIAWAHLQAWLDPRESISHWLAARRDVERGYCELPDPTQPAGGEA